MRRSLLIFVLLFALLLVNAYSKVIYVNSTNCSTQFKKILPGDTIVFLTGNYSNATCGPIYGYNLTFELYNNTTKIYWGGTFLLIPNNSTVKTFYYRFFPYNLSYVGYITNTSGFQYEYLNATLTKTVIYIEDNVSADVYLEIGNASVYANYWNGGIYAPNLTLHLYKNNNNVETLVGLTNITCSNLYITGKLLNTSGYTYASTKFIGSLFITDWLYWNPTFASNIYIHTNNMTITNASLSWGGPNTNVTVYNIYANGVYGLGFTNLYANNLYINNSFLEFGYAYVIGATLVNHIKFNSLFMNNSTFVLHQEQGVTNNTEYVNGNLMVVNNSVIKLLHWNIHLNTLINISQLFAVFNNTTIDISNSYINNSLIECINISGNTNWYNDKIYNNTYFLGNTTGVYLEKTYSLIGIYGNNATLYNISTINNTTIYRFFIQNNVTSIENSTINASNFTANFTSVRLINSSLNTTKLYIHLIYNITNPYYAVSEIYNSKINTTYPSDIQVNTISNSYVENSVIITNSIKSSTINNCTISNNLTTDLQISYSKFYNAEISTISKYINISNSEFLGICKGIISNYLVGGAVAGGNIIINLSNFSSGCVISGSNVEIYSTSFNGNINIYNSSIVGGVKCTLNNVKSTNIVIGNVSKYINSPVSILYANSVVTNNLTIINDPLTSKDYLNYLETDILLPLNSSISISIENSTINKTPVTIDSGNIYINNLTFNYTLSLKSPNININKLIINKTYSILSIVQPNLSFLTIKNSDIWTGTDFTNGSDINISGTKLEFAIVGDKNKINLTNDYMYNSYINATSVSHIKMIGTNFTGTIQCPTVYLNASGSNISGTFNVGLFNEFNIYNSNVSTSSYINITNATYLNQFIEYSNVTSKLINTSANLYINNSSIHNDILSSATLYIYNSNTNNINTSKIEANNSKILNITAEKLVDIRYGSFINLNVVNPWYTTLIHDTFNNLIGNTHVFTLSYDNANLVNLTIDHGLIEIKYSDVNDTYLNVTNATEDVENSTIKVFNETIKRTPSTTSLISTVSNYYKFITDTINNLYVNFTLNEIPINYTLNSYVIFNTSKLGKTYIKINQQGYFKNITFNVFISGNTITSPTSNVYILIPGNATNTYLEGNTINTTLFTLKTDSLNSSFIGKVLLINDNITETNEPLVPIKLRYNYGIYYVFVNGEPIKFGTISNTTAKEVIAWVNNSCGYLYNDTIGTVYGCANISESNITLIETPENNISIKNSEFAEIMAKNSSVTIVNSKVYYHYFNNAPILYNNVSIVAYYLNVNGLDCEINKTCILFADSNGTIENSKLCPTQGFSFAIVNTSQNFNVYNSYFDSVALIPDYNVYNITIISPSDFAKYILDYPDSDMWCNGTPMYQIVSKKVNKSKNMTVVYLKKPKFIVIEKRGKNKIPIVLITLGIILILAKILVKILF